MASTLDDFLRPLYIDLPKIHSLAKSLCETFVALAAESQVQFLPTPVSEELLRPKTEGRGKFLAIDIGGTNLRVGFIELLEPSISPSSSKGRINESPDVSSRVSRHLEKSWPIGEHLKQEKADDLFAWIGQCIAQVVQEGCKTWPREFQDEMPLGIAFSFPMIQDSMSEAKIMSMGKGFAITANSNLGEQLLRGYDLARTSLQSLPRLRIAAIVNDAVSTLVSFTHQHRHVPRRKAAMGLIVGTGSNATIPLSISKLHPSKRPATYDPGSKITVNTEWTISGASSPLHELAFFTRWDSLLDSQCEAPGFQPFEYMTSGRYLGELGRIILFEYFTTQLNIPEEKLPDKVRHRLGLTTSFLGNLGSHLAETTGETDMAKQLEKELPGPSGWTWAPGLASVAFTVGKAVEVRAAGMTAAAVVGLLGCAGELPLSQTTSLTNGVEGHRTSEPMLEELMVGYTGGCIVHFQDYLTDCQSFLDRIIEMEFTERGVPRVVLMPCHDGGILGAGILAGTVEAGLWHYERREGLVGS